MPEALEKRDTPIVGFRAWVIKPDDALHSVAMSTTWNKDVTPAACLAKPGPQSPDHITPADHCRCGLHARTTIDGVREEYPYFPVHGYWAYMSTPTNSLMCMGAVLMWGRVLRGDKVIRAEHARIICLTDPDPLWIDRTGANNPGSIPQERRDQRQSDLDRISARYQVPIIPYRACTAYASEFGELAKTDHLK
jgi:hypothetical protein